MSEVWPARAAEAADVTRLLIAFRDWLGEELPDGDAFAASVAHLVEEAARGRGVGGALVGLACERASERGARRIELDANEHNRGAIALYESLGFSSASKVHGKMRGRDLFMGRRLP